MAGYESVLLSLLRDQDARLSPLETVDKVLGVMSPGEVIEEVSASGLRGRGGAGFPTGKKWQIVSAETADEKYIIANGAEGEPGSYKDRLLLKQTPQAVVAGLILAGYAVGARKGYVYIHHEAEDCMEAVSSAIEEARRLGYLGAAIKGGYSLDLQVHVAGIGYVAGEETAVIRVIEGSPAKPRPKPPYPTVKGLWGKPTVVNNIETLANVEVILRKGAEGYRRLGTPDTPGTILVSLNGVARPGVYEVPAGVPVGEVIYKCGGGPLGKIKAVLPGGYASGFLGADELDTPLEHRALLEKGSALGSATIHVFDESRCMVEVTRKVMKFFAAETCGQCFPCREGTRDFLRHTLEAERGTACGDWQHGMDAIFELVGRKTICGLDKAAEKAMRSALRLFEREFKEHLYGSSCSVCYSEAANP